MRFGLRRHSAGFFTVVRTAACCARERWGAGTMARETRSHARVAGEGPRPTRTRTVFFTVARDRPAPYGNTNRFFHRSARACPSRSPASKDGVFGPTDLKRRFFHSTNDGAGNPLACACGMRGPAPYGEGGFMLSVVCDRRITNSSGAGAPELQGRRRAAPASVGVQERWRGTGPRPTVKGAV